MPKFDPIEELEMDLLMCSYVTPPIAHEIVQFLLTEGFINLAQLEEYYQDLND